MAPGRARSPSVDETWHAKESAPAQVLSLNLKLGQLVLCQVAWVRVRLHDDNRLARGGVLSMECPRSRCDVFTSFLLVATFFLFFEFAVHLYFIIFAFFSLGQQSLLLHFLVNFFVLFLAVV